MDIPFILFSSSSPPLAINCSLSPSSPDSLALVLTPYEEEAQGQQWVYGREGGIVNVLYDVAITCDTLREGAAVGVDQFRSHPTQIFRYDDVLGTVSVGDFVMEYSPDGHSLFLSQYCGNSHQMWHLVPSPFAQQHSLHVYPLSFSSSFSVCL